MARTPHVVTEPERPYVGVRAVISMRDIAAVADRLPEIFGWLTVRDVEPAGAPFFRYHRLDTDETVDIEVGVPTPEPLTGEGDIQPGVLPAGAYAATEHLGHPDQLAGVTAELLEWAAAEGLRWDRREASDGEHWGCRLEVYHTDPRVQPDMNQWETQLLFRLAD